MSANRSYGEKTLSKWGFLLPDQVDNRLWKQLSWKCMEWSGFCPAFAPAGPGSPCTQWDHSAQLWLRGLTEQETQYWGFLMLCPSTRPPPWWSFPRSMPSATFLRSKLPLSIRFLSLSSWPNSRPPALHGPPGLCCLHPILLWWRSS